MFSIVFHPCPCFGSLTILHDLSCYGDIVIFPLLAFPTAIVPALSQVYRQLKAVSAFPIQEIFLVSNVPNVEHLKLEKSGSPKSSDLEATFSYPFANSMLETVTVQREKGAWPPGEPVGCHHGRFERSGDGLTAPGMNQKSQLHCMFCHFLGCSTRKIPFVSIHGGAQI